MSTYNLFISHSWTYSNAYQGLLALLNAKPYFSYNDYSVPKNNPVHNAPTSHALYQAITRQMQPTQVVLIMAGVYATYSTWIDNEIKIAKSEFSNPKPIIAIEPWGAEKTSRAVKDAADKIVRWNTDSIVDAIRELT